jgi:hypothetical protein
MLNNPSTEVGKDRYRWSRYPRNVRETSVKPRSERWAVIRAERPSPFAGAAVVPSGLIRTWSPADLPRRQSWRQGFAVLPGRRCYTDAIRARGGRLARPGVGEHCGRGGHSELGPQFGGALSRGFEAVRFDSRRVWARRRMHSDKTDGAPMRLME